MRRREFIAAFVGGPFTAASSQAQQPGKLYRVGVLSADTAPPGLLEDFEEELRKLGYVRGENIIVEERNAAGDYRRLALLADELVKLGVDVILAVNTPAVQAAKKVTARIPIVMTRVANPVKTGLVPSLSKQGGNITGMSFFPDELSAKRLQLLKEVLPSVSRVAVLSDEGNVGTTLVIGEMEAPSRQLGIELLVLSVSGPGDFVGAFEAAKRGHAEALILVDNAFFTKHRAEFLIAQRSIRYLSSRCGGRSPRPVPSWLTGRELRPSTAGRRTTLTAFSRARAPQTCRWSSRRNLS
jgi:putative tryptophan/tyrosine transport system substrate-binding protein